MSKVLLTEVFNKHKERFLIKHCGNSRIASAIKIMIRDLEYTENSTKMELRADKFDVSIGVNKSITLCCNYFVNPKTGDVVPFYFSILEEMAKTPIDETDMPEMLESVLNELGWI